MQIKDLKPNVRNPRKMSDKKLELLKASLAKYGDLSGFVYNRRSKTLIGGHQKQKTIPLDSQIKIQQKYDPPTSTGTVADGYVLINGERFKYREVDVSPEIEMEMMIAANKHSGDWDADILKLGLADFKNLDLNMAGFEAPELEAFGINYEVMKQEVVPRFEPVNKSTGAKKAETDEQYVANTPQTTEQIDTESPNMNVVGNTQEKAMNAIGKRFVIIIDCTSQEHKDALKEKIAPVVKDAGGKFF